MHVLEWIAVVFNLGYLYYARKQQRTGWIFGGLGSLLYILINFEAALYQDMLLQLIYVLAAVWGWVKWGSSQQNDIYSRKLNDKQKLSIALIGIIFPLVLGFLLTPLQAGFAYWDSTVTIWSLMATGLTIYRFIENWPLWIIINLGIAGMYYQKCLFPTTILYLIYTDLAIEGWILWKSKLSSRDE